MHRVKLVKAKGWTKGHQTIREVNWDNWNMGNTFACILANGFDLCMITYSLIWKTIRMGFQLQRSLSWGN